LFNEIFLFIARDLMFVKKVGFKKAIIFRLGGLNREYVKVIGKFI